MHMSHRSHLMLSVTIICVLAACAPIPEKAQFPNFVLHQMSYNRNLTREVISGMEKTGQFEAALRFRPPTGRAPIAFQLMHIAAADDVLLAENLALRPPISAAFIDQYARGKPSAAVHPTRAVIEEYLSKTSKALRAHIKGMRAAELDRKPHPKAWGTNYEMLQNVVFHEAHHQGQAHLTLNIFRAR